MKNKNPSIAFVQQPPVYLNLEASVNLAISYIDKISKDDNDLIIFPESWLPGYPVWLDYAPEAGLWDHPPAKALYRLLVENAIVFGEDLFGKLQQAIEKVGINVVIGVHEKDGGTLYNTMIFFNGDGSYRIHRKLMPTYTERLIWGMGDGSTLASLDTDYGTLGGLICWEHWMPLARTAMHAKNETVHVSQWPYVKELHQLCSRHYAFEGQCFVAASGGVLSKQEMLDGIKSLELNTEDEPALELVESIPVAPEELVLKGGSALIAPDSSYVTEPLYDKRDIIYAEADLSLIDEGHLFLDTDGHYARPDVFNLEVDTRPKKNVSFKD